VKEANSLCPLALLLAPSQPGSVARVSISPSLKQLKWFPAPLGETWEQQALSQYKRQAKAGF